MKFSLSRSSLKKEIEKTYEILVMKRLIEQELSSIGLYENSFLQEAMIQDYKMQCEMDKRFNLYNRHR